MKKFTYIFTCLVLITILSPVKVFAKESCTTYQTQKECESNTGVNGEKCVWFKIDIPGGVDNYTYMCVPGDTNSGSDDDGSGSYRDDTDDKEDNSNLPEFLEPEENVSCGKVNKIPKYIPFITSLTITVLTIISMGMLVIMGTIDLFKGINSGNPDEMKKNQKAFFNRLGSAALLFFIVALTKLLVSLVSASAAGGNGIVDCISCFVNNNCG